MNKSDSETRWSVRFEWDEKKRVTNIAKHGIDFRVALQAFRDPGSVEYVSQSESGEARCILIGAVEGRILAVVYTVRQMQIRIISARVARRAERELWTANTS